MLTVLLRPARSRGANARDLSTVTKPRKYYTTAGLSARTLRSPGIARGLVCQRRPARRTRDVRVHPRALHARAYVSRWARLAIPRVSYASSTVRNIMRFPHLDTLLAEPAEHPDKRATFTRSHNAPGCAHSYDDDDSITWTRVLNRTKTS